MTRSIALSAVKVCVARVMTAAMPAIGAEHAAGQHGGGDQRADRQLSVEHQEHADDDHQQAA